MSDEELIALLLCAGMIVGPLGFADWNLINANAKQNGEYTVDPAKLLQWLTFAVLFVQAWISRRQSRIMKGQLEVSSRQADIYDRQAVSAEIAQRAFITINATTIRFEKSTGSSNWTKVNVGIQFINNGETATKWAVCRANVMHVPVESSLTPEHINFADVTGSETFCLLIGAKNTLIGTSIDSELIDVIFVDGQLMYIWGWIEYNDIFDRVTRHRTEFSMRGRVTVYDNGSDPQWIGHAFGRFNGADDECMHKPKTPCRPYNPATPAS